MTNFRQNRLSGESGVTMQSLVVENHQKLFDCSLGIQRAKSTMCLCSFEK